MSLPSGSAPNAVSKSSSQRLLMYRAAPSRSAKRLSRLMFILLRNLRQSFLPLFGTMIFVRIERA